MFPLEQKDELLFQISSDPNQQQHKIPQGQILSFYHDHHQSMVNPHHAIINSGTNGLRKKEARVRSSPCGMESRDSKKKMVHRDVERQRRHQMAKLHSLLRSLLPLEFIKGKRSISDQMEESVKYIKHLQKNIKDLRYKRDQLIEFGHANSLVNSSSRTKDDVSRLHQVLVRESLVGVEIVFGSSSVLSRRTNIPLSTLLRMLLEDGLSILTSASTKVSDMMIHTIHCQASDGAGSINVKELQDKLCRLKLQTS